MKNLFTRYIKKERILGFFLLVFGALTVNAQSTNSEFPTPVTTNEISGRIAARDIGDARLTSYYYVFNGTQGDIFINVNANNFNGDVDIFASEGLRPLSKIRLFADASPTETGRIVYLRQPLKLILRVEGRTPDDNPATFTIKFAGSFAAIEGAEQTAPDTPKIESEQRGSVKVNSVGTIIEEKKTTETLETAETATTEDTAEPKKEEPVKPKKVKEPTKSKVVAADNTKGSVDAGDETEVKTAPETKETIARNKKSTRKTTVKTDTVAPPERTKKVATEETKKETAADPLENVRLVVLMKNGEKVEYPMPEVFRFSLNNNVLTVILKNGKIERRSILEIQRFSVE